MWSGRRRLGWLRGFWGEVFEKWSSERDAIFFGPPINSRQAPDKPGRGGIPILPDGSGQAVQAATGRGVRPFDRASSPSAYQLRAGSRAQRNTTDWKGDACGGWMGLVFRFCLNRHNFTVVMLAGNRLLGFWAAALLLLWGMPCLAQPGSPSTRMYETVDRLPAGWKIEEGTSLIPPDSAVWLLPDSLKLSGELPWNADCPIGKRGSAFHVAKARLHEDALVITLVRVQRDYIDQLDIWVWEGEEFRCGYSRRARQGLSSVPAFTTDQVLVLEKTKFASGNTLRGYINFRATQAHTVHPDMPWDTRKDWVESELVVRGPFKVIIE